MEKELKRLKNQLPERFPNWYKFYIMTKRELSHEDIDSFPDEHIITVQQGHIIYEINMWFIRARAFEFVMRSLPNRDEVYISGIRHLMQQNINVPDGRVWKNLYEILTA